MLVEDKVSRTLANLINQTNTLGLTIDQYLSSIGKTAETLRAEYKEKIVGQLKLQFALDEIAEKEKIAESGYRIGINCGKEAGQIVSHLHFHLIGGWKKHGRRCL